MPVYLYRCPTCNAQRDIVKKLAEIDNEENCLRCGFAMNRQIVAPMLRPDYEPYKCPITGDLIQGRRQHEENLRKHGCRVLEQGEAQEATRTREARDEAFFESVGETAARLVANMPAEKQERLANEIDAGIGLAVERSTPTTA